MAITLDGTLGITTPTYGGAVTAEYSVPVTGFKNRILNGAMMIDQRNAGASVTASDATYTLDRWIIRASQASKFTVQQNAGSVTPPNGFIKYLGITSSSAYTVGVSEYFDIAQRIEGLNVADFGWGSVGASTVTLSFWVRSSLTGTFGGTLNNSDYTRSYPFTYTISSANTWEQKTITILGDTSGTWSTSNTTGIQINFGLGAGANVSGTSGSWSGSTYLSATGATSVVGTNGATFYITGVQLEKGSTATSFDYRPYGTELQLCQRYYEKSYDIDVVPGGGSNLGLTKLISFIYGSFYYPGTIIFKQTKRTAPTMSFWSDANTAGSWTFYNSSTSAQVSVTATNTGMSSTALTGSGSTYSYCQGQWVASAEL